MIAISPARILSDRARPAALLVMMLALLGTVLISGWHDAVPHIHGAGGIEYTMQATDHHDGDRHDDGSSPANDPMHLAAHLVIQGVAIPDAPVLASVAPIAPALWVPSRPAVTGSSPVEAILRPPRA